MKKTLYIWHDSQSVLPALQILVRHSVLHICDAMFKGRIKEQTNLSIEKIKMKTKDFVESMEF